MNKRILSSQFMGSRAQIFLSQQSTSQLQKEHQQKELQHYKKQNNLLKKQLQQLKSVHSQTKKELTLYRSIANKSLTTGGESRNSNKEERDVRMNELFQMQQKRIFDLETDLEILRGKYNKSVLGSGGNGGLTSKQAEYAAKCKELENRLIKCESEYQREIVYLKQKLMRHNADQIMMEKSKSSNFVSSVSSELKPLSKKLNRIDAYK